MSQQTNKDELIVGLVSVSDRASGGIYQDKGIPALQDWLATAISTPYRIETRLIPDERARIEDDLRRMYEWGSATGARLSVFTFGRAFVIPAFPDFSERVARLNELTRTLAADYDAAVADCWDHPFNDRQNLVSADGVHFATTGQAVIASLLIETLGTGLRPGR